MPAGEPDPWVMLPAGIPTGLPEGYLYGPAPVSSLNPLLEGRGQVVANLGVKGPKKNEIG